MSFRSLYSNSHNIKALCQAKYIKRISILPGKLWRRREVSETFCDSSMRRIICTDSKLQRSLSCQLKVMPEIEVSLFLQESSIIQNIKYSDLIVSSNNSQGLEELLSEQEFKDILSRSVFHYDVNLASYGPTQKLLSSSVIGSSVPGVKLLNCENNKSSDSFEVLIEGQKDAEQKPDLSGKPTKEQLLLVIDKLTYTLLNFFEKPHNFSIYHRNIEFQNNIKGVITRGISAYMQSMYLMKFYGFIQYAKVKVEVLKITHHVEDGTIRVRWRVNGITRQKLLMLMLKLKTVSLNTLTDADMEWLDGFSVFSVDQDGLIYKHVCDKMIPDDEVSTAKMNDFRSRLLGLLGLSQRGPATGSLNAMLAYPRGAQISQGILPYEKLK